jgi:hypothetical protein
MHDNNAQHSSESRGATIVQYLAVSLAAVFSAGAASDLVVFSRSQCWFSIAAAAMVWLRPPARFWIACRSELAMHRAKRSANTVMWSSRMSASDVFLRSEFLGRFDGSR